MLTFNTDGMVPQKFPFPAPIMDYIYKNLTASQLLKLYQTCKFFYDKFKLNIIEHFEICDDKEYERIIGNSMGIWDENPAWLKLNNLWITKSFTVTSIMGNVEIDYTKFARLTFDKLEFLYDTPVKDFDFLVNNTPTLRHLIVDGSIYYPAPDDDDDDDDDPEKELSIEEIIERAPQVSSFDLSLDTEDNLTLDMTKLITLERQIKLTYFHLNYIFQIPDPVQVVEFFMKHGTPDIDYYFRFIFDNAAADIKTFYKAINTEFQSWKLSLQLPPTISSSFIDLTGKTALITGAAEGIGRATVILFRQLGASVIAFARNKYDLHALNDECQNISNAGFLHTISHDTYNGIGTDKLFERIDCKFGTKFDVLVNIVDTTCWDSIPDIALEHQYSHDRYILKCHYNLIVEATKYLIEAKGCIINVSKSDGWISRPEDVDKIAELEQFIKNVETELVSSGVRINNVNPGALSTALPRHDGMTDAAYKKHLQESKKSREEQSAKAITFLASDAAKLINGSTLPL